MIEIKIKIAIAIRKDGTFLDGLLGAHRHGGKEKEQNREDKGFMKKRSKKMKGHKGRVLLNRGVQV